MQDNDKKQLIHITNKHSGKMDNMNSLSTSCLENPNCIARVKNNVGVCAHCFACAQFKYHTNNQFIFAFNTMILNKIIPVEMLPFITQTNYKMYFRFEAFGDLASVEQVINYFNICEKNKHLHFALWTKNPNYIKVAIEKHGCKKPKNLNIIFSVIELDASNEIKNKAFNKFDFIDKTFSVYTNKSTAAQQTAIINCGEKKCIECGLCYEKNKIKNINELLK